MPQITYRANLQSRHFPLLAQLWGQTVIIPERDQVYVPNVNPQEDQVAVDRGIPLIYYAENVFPSTYGYQSVGYSQRVAGISSTGFSSVREILQTTNGYTTYVARDTSAGNLRVLNINRQWVVPTGGPTGLNDTNVLSVATVNGISYLCVARRGVYRVVQGTTPSLQAVTLKGIDMSGTLGILSSIGYLIVWSETGVAWSSTSDPLDFEPSDETGAGAGEIQDAAGKLVWCQNTSYGFIVYTEGNAVQATWSGNVVHPWNFRGIPSSGGISSGDVVSKDANGQHYVYDTNGLQQVFHTGAKTVLPWITDFISGRELDEWDPVAGNIVVRQSAAPMKKKLAFISDRYLVISYGLSQQSGYSFALVYDVVQSRVGRLKIPHTHCFEIKDMESEGIETPRESLAFLQANGAIQVVDFRLQSQDKQGVMLIGKFQVVRGQLSQMVQVNLENFEDSDFVLKLLSSLDGKNFLPPVEGYLMHADGQNRVFNFSEWGKNHTLLIEGSFNMISLELTLNVDGKVM
jgi:hypothetical protein